MKCEWGLSKVANNPEKTCPAPLIGCNLPRRGYFPSTILMRLELDPDFHGAPSAFAMPESGIWGPSSPEVPLNLKKDGGVQTKNALLPPLTFLGVPKFPLPLLRLLIFTLARLCIHTTMHKSRPLPHTPPSVLSPPHLDQLGKSGGGKKACEFLLHFFCSVLFLVFPPLSAQFCS